MTERNFMGKGVCAALVLAIGFVFATPGFADERKRSTMTQDVIESVDADAGTITLSSGTFRVAEKTRLFDTGGRPIGIRELAAEGGGILVEFRAARGGSRSGSTPVMRALKLVEGEFE